MPTNSLLGTGWRFPLRIGPHGGFAYSGGEQDVAEAIHLILGTARGERPMRPRFGCGMHDYVFAAVDETTRGNVAQQVHEALTEWEPRIDVIDIDVDWRPEDESLLLVRIAYRIRTSNAFHNLVYPFYLHEGAQS